jgi:hypothetical protein
MLLIGGRKGDAASGQVGAFGVGSRRAHGRGDPHHLFFITAEDMLLILSV